MPLLCLCVRKPLRKVPASDPRAFVFLLLIVEAAIGGHFDFVELCGEVLEELTIAFKSHLKAFDADFVPRVEPFFLKCVDVGSKLE